MAYVDLNDPLTQFKSQQYYFRLLHIIFIFPAFFYYKAHNNTYSTYITHDITLLGCTFC